LYRINVTLQLIFVAGLEKNRNEVQVPAVVRVPVIAAARSRCREGPHPHLGLSPCPHSLLGPGRPGALDDLGDLYLWIMRGSGHLGLRRVVDLGPRGSGDLGRGDQVTWGGGEQATWVGGGQGSWLGGGNQGS
jgi:hypothetical protein